MLLKELKQVPKNYYYGRYVIALNNEIPYRNYMYITINQCRLFFDVYGSSLAIGPNSVKTKPILLILHGGPGLVDHSIYVEFWAQFADIAQVVFLDQRGCGRSDYRSAKEWNLETWADDVHIFCQTLGIEKPIIAGISMGGHVLCEFNSRYPEQAGGLIFCNTEARFIIDDICSKLGELGGTEVAEIARKQLTNPSPETAKLYQEKCVKFYAKNAYTSQELGRCLQNMEVFSHYYKNHISAFSYLDSLSTIQCPTLLMAGALSPLHLPARAKEMFAKIKPSLATLHIFEQAGAPVYKDSPEEAEKVVREFLEKLALLNTRSHVK
jgi:proline iminopeptidase